MLALCIHGRKVRVLQLRPVQWNDSWFALISCDLTQPLRWICHKPVYDLKTATPLLHKITDADLLHAIVSDHTFSNITKKTIVRTLHGSCLLFFFLIARNLPSRSTTFLLWMQITSCISIRVIWVFVSWWEVNLSFVPSFKHMPSFLLYP